MAKLNVIVPAVNVMVESVEYRLVDRKAVTGDIVRIADEDAKGCHYLTVGAFYKVDRIDACNDPQIADDDGDEHDLCGWDYEVYEKVAEVPAEPKRRLTVGDYARITGNVNCHNYEQGSVVKIVEVVTEGKDRSYIAEKANGTNGNYLWEQNTVFAAEAEFLAQKKPVVEAATEPTQSDVVVHEGRRYRKVARKADVGELVVIVDAYPFGGKYANGDILTVRKPFIGDWVYLGDIDYATNPAEYNVLEPAESSTPEPAPQYREVKRKANVGERIRIVNAKGSGGLYKNGDELVASRTSSNGGVIVDMNGREAYVSYLWDEYVVLETAITPTTAVAEPQPPRLKVGDFAKVVAKTSIHVSDAIKADDIVKVVEDDESEYLPFKAESLSSSKYGWFRKAQLVRATDEEVAAAKRALDPRSKFAAGDNVRLVDGGSSWPLGGFENGKVYEVSDPFTTSHGGIRVAIRGRITGFALPDQLVKVTAAEVAELERKAAEEAKWSAIGRKVDEYKAGDIVRFTESTGASDYGTGSVAEIRNVRGTDFNFGIDCGYLGSFSWCELVTPVEQRFDTPATA